MGAKGKGMVAEALFFANCGGDGAEEMDQADDDEEQKEESEQEFYENILHRIKYEVLPWCMEQPDDLAEPHLFFGGSDECFRGTMNHRMLYLESAVLSSNKRVGHILIHVARILIEKNSGYLYQLEHFYSHELTLDEILQNFEEYDSEYTNYFPQSGVAEIEIYERGSPKTLRKECRQVQDVWDAQRLLEKLMADE